MGVETRGTGGSAGRMGARAAMLGAVAGVALLPAGAAQANVVGVGNAAFGNTCASHDDARAEGATVTGSGLANGNQTGLPLSLPRNHCGNSGIICTAVFMSSV
ncbi:hypothetical protein HY68_23495 [Streptomyces sp. AcH 505]|uniref:chaplin family protein n=1 Tax=unclassified Streptomyces TaxID=2593676 RepID=UPI00059223E2|nr:chaplin family protein [Streptomyces sp. NBC_00370]KIF70896.1 hypothetical protein HY68_23495 [Streptomyces sp. AcH 505]